MATGVEMGAPGQRVGSGGTIMMWDPGVPANMSHGTTAPGRVDSPVVSWVAMGV